MKTTRLILKGATCPSCRLAIEKYTRKLKAVSDISMEPGTGTMTVIHDETANPAPEIQELVRKLGYEAVLAE